jgi:hypothetical protein
MSLLYWLLGLDNTSAIHSATRWDWHCASPLSLPYLALLMLCAIIAAGLNMLRGNVMPLATRAGLTGIRIAGFFLLWVMLSQVELRLELDRVAPPDIAVLTDTSSSMSLSDVNGKTRAEAAQQLKKDLAEQLGSRANLPAYTFDSSLRSGEKIGEASGFTRLYDSLNDLAHRESSLQGIVLLSDGNDTQGNTGTLASTLLASRRIPVHPVVLGESGAPKMASVKVSANAPYVRLGDELRLTAQLNARDLGEQVVSVKLMEEGREQPVSVRENIRLGKDPVDVGFTIKPDKPGTKTYRFIMEGVSKSVSTQTLAAEHTVQVLNSKIRVLYLDIPRDERKILGHWLARDPVIDLAMLTMLPKGGWYAQGALKHKNSGDGLPNQEADLYQYEVVILGDIPRAYFRAGGDVAETKMQWLSEFVSRRGGALITLGGRSVYAGGQYQDSALSRILPFEIPPTDKPDMPKKFRITPTPIALAHPAMLLEPSPQANREAWFDLPTLDGSNRVGKVKASATLLASRETKEEGAFPVIAMQNVGKGTVFSLAVDTTWLWEMKRPAEGEDYYRRFWGNVVRSIAPDPRLEPNKPQIVKHQSETAVGQTITLSTRLVDGVYQPIRNADLIVKVTSPSGKITTYYPADGRSTPGLYEYDVALTEAGDWQVSTSYKNQTTTEKIRAGLSSQELDDPRAMPEAMNRLATATGGKMFKSSDSAASIIQALNLEPRHFTQSATIAVWNLPACMVLFVALVCVDCLIRKRRGMA